MGCFTVLKNKKKKSEQATYLRRVNPQENSPTTLPEPHTRTQALQSAPPSFRTRVKPVQPINKVKNNRTRALSAPSSLIEAEQDALSSVDCDEQEESKSRIGPMKEHRSPSPQPLPLPSPQIHNAVVLKTMGSFKSVTSSGPINASGPLPLPPSGTLRNFSYEEIAAACQNFCPERCMSEGLSSVIYRASFGDDTSGSKKLNATVTRLHPSTQGLREFVNEVNTLASLQHPNLCKLIGFHAREGLTFLHEEGPFQAMFNEFSTANIQIDKDFSAKLSGYGCITHIPETEISKSSVESIIRDANSASHIERYSSNCLSQNRFPESRLPPNNISLRGPKCAIFASKIRTESSLKIATDIKERIALLNKLVGYGLTYQNGEGILPFLCIGHWQIFRWRHWREGCSPPRAMFGVLELCFLNCSQARKNLDSRHRKEEKNLVKWSRPFLADDCRLSLIMDPQLKGRFALKAARKVADIAQRCLQTDPSERPTMRTVVEHLKTVQDMKYSCRYPLQEPRAIGGKHMARSSSLNGIVTPAPTSNFSPSPPTTRPYISPRPLPLPMSLPTQTCSSILSLDGVDHQESQKSSSSRRASVEGF
ncbi:protein kinase superfamily protein [Actinidia rufa]|uniref:Protein kinase superfamily protein n=1 Tax=Actinidia rufa TaxID=165716 RepID=A0A7J0E7H9_9ERIC|nr:protein kinase superfamily protein [Actinidia rufa]